MTIPLSRPTAMQPAEATKIVALARDIVGITINAGKTDFLAGRLRKRLEAHGLTSYGAYCDLLKKHSAERQHFTEALTTHTTSFFREAVQYDWLSDVGFPGMSERVGHGELTIWSAACSTGQEGYSALMIANAGREMGNWRFKANLIGTDVSRPVLKRAEAGIYTRQDIEGIPPQFRPNALLSSKTSQDVFRIAPELRVKATWRRANLATGEGLDGIRADVVFLRNVLIYFDEATRKEVIRNILKGMKPDGVLLTGHTEALHDRPDGLDVVKPSIYRKNIT